MVDEEATKEKQAKADEEAKAAGKDAADPVEPAMRSESKEIWDWRVQNDNKPLWTRSPKEVCTLRSCLSLLSSVLFQGLCTGGCGAPS